VPELPETETIARDLDAAIGGRRIVGVMVSRPDVLRGVSAADLARRTSGSIIQKCWRRAKIVIVDLSSGDRILVQPRFTGALLLDDGGLPERERQYSTMHFELDDGRSLHYRDIRRLGTVSLLGPDEFDAYCGRLGLEPLEADFTRKALSGILRGSGQPVKKVLMDQRRVVGIGNIYANEALWRARIHPARAAREVRPAETARLHQALIEVLSASVAARGTSFRDYRDASGNRGSFAEQLSVYGRAGRPCPRCGTSLSVTHEIDGRSSVLCERCQR
jgi:formamidopyrimidine-DNA glycosylase